MEIYNKDIETRLGLVKVVYGIDSWYADGVNGAIVKIIDKNRNNIKNQFTSEELEYLWGQFGIGAYIEFGESENTLN